MNNIEDYIDYYFNYEVNDFEHGILSGIDLSNKSELLSITDKVLDFPIDKQIHFVFCLLDKYYSISSESDINKNVCSFLAQKVFTNHRDFYKILIDDGKFYYKNGHEVKPNVVLTEDERISNLNNTKNFIIMDCRKRKLLKINRISEK